MKTKIKYLGTILMICISLITNAQITNKRIFPPIDQNNNPSKWYAHPDSSGFQFSLSPDHFLIGTLNGYMGRMYFNPRENTIDNYKDAKHLKKYIFEFIQDYYKTTPDSSDSYYLKEDKVANILNSYFDQEGKITINELKNEGELYSYILGKYLVYGEQLKDNIYKIQIINSFEGDLVYRALKQLECDKILYKKYRGYIPTSEFYYFEATPRMIKTFNELKSLKEKMLDEMISSRIENISEENKEELKQAIIELKSREIIKIKQAFSNEI